MMRVLLADDEPLAVERLHRGLATVPGIEVIGVAADGVETCEKIAALRPDLLLLDVQMPRMTGLEVAEAFAAAPARPDIVFVSAFDQFAVQAFGVEAVDYLRKPVNFERLHRAIERVRSRRKAAAATRAGLSCAAEDDPAATTSASGYPEGIWVPCPKGATWVPIEAIERIDAARDYVALRTSSQSHILRTSLCDLEKRIDPARMVRVHRSHMVCLDGIMGTERPRRGALRLILANGGTLQVGPKYRKEVLSRLARHTEVPCARAIA